MDTKPLHITLQAYEGYSIHWHLGANNIPCVAGAGDGFDVVPLNRSSSSSPSNSPPPPLSVLGLGLGLVSDSWLGRRLVILLVTSPLVSRIKMSQSLATLLGFELKRTNLYIANDTCKTAYWIKLSTANLAY